MAATNFKTENNTFRKLMGNGLTYRVPRFQRDYSWSEAEWEDLWQDIVGTMQPGGEPSHYMGYLVLQSSDDKTFDVIDGQQRLTTLSLIVLASLKGLQRLIEQGVDADRNKQRLDQLRQTYVGYLDPVSLVARSKLTLNRNNDRYYQTYIVPLAPTLPQRGFKASEHALRHAFEWFDKRIGNHMKASSAQDRGMAIAQLVDAMSDKLFFTVITVTDELNAYKVFETLNARGVRLSATDLLKNYLFSVLHRAAEHERELAALEDRWESLVGRLGAESLPEFLRVHWNSRHSAARQSELFKVIRSRISTRQAVFDLLRDMDEDVETFLALTQPDSPGWPSGWRDHVQTLRMFNVRQPFALLLAAKRKLAEADFETVLASCVRISFRYNVIGGYHTADQETAYHAAAQRLTSGAIADARGVLEALRGVYVSDPAFQAAFADKSFRTVASRNRKIVRYIFCQLERQASSLALDADDPNLTVEHILPEHSGTGWESFPDDQIEDLVDRLGNMTLLAASPNRDIGNAGYGTKLDVYKSSKITLTRAIAENYAEWTPEAVDRRQRALSKIATSVWRIAQLA